MAVQAGAARQALGFVEEKLRRVFNLAGPIDAGLDPIVKPVIIVDDLRSPGHAFFQGRSWVYTRDFEGTAVGNWVCTLKFANDCILEGFSLYGPNVPAGDRFRLYYLTPDRQTANPASGVQVTTPLAVWRDRKEKQLDQPPILGNTIVDNLVGDLPTDDNTWLRIPASSPLPGFVPMPAFCPTGSSLNLNFALTTAALVSLSFNVYGRIWPQ